MDGALRRAHPTALHRRVGFTTRIRYQSPRRGDAPMRTKPCLTQADARQMLAACIAEAEKNDWRVTIAIVDDAGVLLNLQRMDGALAISATVAPEKAKASALTRQPTKFWEDRVRNARPSPTFPPGR
jgi:uncharacterized protein GlcG (DUF336 family)